MNPYQVVKDFEAALCEYTGAPYAVTVTSCTAALMLACRYRVVNRQPVMTSFTIPKRTYCSVPQSIINAGGYAMYIDAEWEGYYEIEPHNIYDSARYFSSGMFNKVGFQGSKYICCSFHWTKTLSIGQGGVILHNDYVADKWFRKARFDGRTEGVAPKDDNFDMVGYHCYMSPRDAAEGLSRLAILPKHNEPLPNDDYPDLSQFEVFK